MTIEEAFGIVLCKFRKERLLSQEELSRLSQLDRGFISKLERGKQQPTLVTMFELASALNVSVQKILSEIEFLLSLNKTTFDRHCLNIITREKLLELFGGSNVNNTIASGRNTILLVEDEVYLRDFLSGLLMERGFNVTTAEDGQAAVDMYKSAIGRVDLVLMDIMMPRKDGVAAYKEIMEFDPDAKILLMSGYSSVALGEIMNINFIQKPMLPNKLMASINSLLCPE